MKTTRQYKQICFFKKQKQKHDNDSKMLEARGGPPMAEEDRK